MCCNLFFELSVSFCLLVRKKQQHFLQVAFHFLILFIVVSNLRVVSY